MAAALPDSDKSTTLVAPEEMAMGGQLKIADHSDRVRMFQDVITVGRISIQELLNVGI